jgi:energy-coupling factor transport system permease protein
LAVYRPSSVPGGDAVIMDEPAEPLNALYVQQLHVPPRFAYRALAAFRLLPLLSADWGTIHRARRARGIDAGRSPLRAVGLFGSAVYALLIAAIRRGARLALAMDSRGFDSRGPRTAARHQQVRAADWVLVLLVALVVGAANVLAVVLGTWHPLLG